MATSQRCVGVVLALCCVATFLHAATWYVDDVTDALEDGSTNHPFDEIQETLDVAGNNDTIIVKDGRYIGAGNKNLDFKGKAIVLQSETSSTNSVIDCEGVGRGFHFHSGETTSSVVRGFTICNANTNAVISPVVGGFQWLYGSEPSGVYCVSNSGPSIENCKISGNLAMTYQAAVTSASPDGYTAIIIADGSGGGVYCEASSPVFRECTIVSNTAGIHGGGLHAVSNAAPVFIDCLIARNMSGLLSTTIVEVVSVPGGTIASTIAHTHGRGGGVSCEQSGMTMSNCSVVANRSGNAGGGIACLSATARVVGCAVEENWLPDNQTPARGGGIACFGSVLFLADSTLSNNTAGQVSVAVAIDTPVPGGVNWTRLVTAGGLGGGLFCAAATAIVEHCDITDNIGCLAGGGVHCWSNSTLVITNSIVDGNTVIDNESPGQAGGLRCLDSNVAVTDCRISNNRAWSNSTFTTIVTAFPWGGATTRVTVASGIAGAIASERSGLRVRQSLIHSNVSAQYGSGIMCVSNVHTSIERCWIGFNEICRTSTSYAIRVVEPVPGGDVTTEIRTDARSANPGGVYCLSSNLAIRDCMVYSNLGGVFLGSGSSATAENCIVVKNLAEWRYGMTSVVTTVGLDTWVESNECVSASMPGAALVLSNASATLRNCTVAENNIEDYSNAVWCVTNAHLALLNTIIWKDGLNISPDSSVTARYSCIQGGFAGEGNVNQDAGLTYTYRLKDTSPCIDAGTSTNAPVTDFEGEARWDHPGHPNVVSTVDIGADEFVDTDGDTIADGWEVEVFSNLTTVSDATDLEGDGLHDDGEYNNSTNPQDADTDDDDMPDLWEVNNGTDPIRNDSLEDPDFDRQKNVEEYVADTIPTNGDSFFAMTNCRAWPPLDSVAFGWHSSTGREYTIWSSPDLGSEWYPQTNLAGVVGSMGYTNHGGMASNYLFRIDVRMTP